MEGSVHSERVTIQATTRIAIASGLESVARFAGSKLIFGFRDPRVARYALTLGFIRERLQRSRLHIFILPSFP